MKSLYLCMPINKIVGNGKYNEAFFHKIQSSRKIGYFGHGKLQNMVSICVDEAIMHIYINVELSTWII